MFVKNENEWFYDGIWKCPILDIVQLSGLLCNVHVIWKVNTFEWTVLICTKQMSIVEQNINVFFQWESMKLIKNSTAK